MTRSDWRRWKDHCTRSGQAHAGLAQGPPSHLAVDLPHALQLVLQVRAALGAEVDRVHVEDGPSCSVRVMRG